MPQKPQFVSERIAPEAGAFDTAPLSRGEPSLPAAFTWRDHRYEVARATVSRRQMGEDRGDQYVRRHYHEIETTDGLRMVLYFERNPSDRSKRKAWWLYTVTFPDPVIETPRLRLRQWTYADRDAFRLMTADPDVMRFIHNSVPFSAAEADDALASTIEHYKRGFGDWAITTRADDSIMGESGLTSVRTNGEVEIGWMLRRPAWGQGFAFEAASAVRNYAFDVLNLTRLVAFVRRENERSISLIRKLGMGLVGPTVDRFGQEVLEYALEPTSNR